MSELFVLAVSEVKYTFTVSDGKSTITKCSGTESKVVISSMFGGYLVVSISGEEDLDCGKVVTYFIKLQ